MPRPAPLLARRAPHEHEHEHKHEHEHEHEHEHAPPRTRYASRLCSCSPQDGQTFPARACARRVGCAAQRRELRPSCPSPKGAVVRASVLAVLCACAEFLIHTAWRCCLLHCFGGCVCSQKVTPTQSMLVVNRDGRANKVNNVSPVRAVYTSVSHAVSG